MSEDFNEKNYSVKMDKTIQSFKKDLLSLRTGRANAAMLDLIKVDVYGQMMPINQLATVSVPEARLITVQVWDQSNVKLVDSAIQKSDLGINPQIDGGVLRLRIPDLTEERRKEFIKICGILGVGIPTQFSLMSFIKDDKTEPSFKGKVIIIGAGAGGLSAGYLLQQQGIDFEILEASAISST